MQKVSIVSTDGHAVLPAELWPEYLERRFHEYLPALRSDDEINRRSMYPLNDAMMVPALEVFDTDGVYRAGGWEGAWDADVRLAQLDREGVAAELATKSRTPFDALFVNWICARADAFADVFVIVIPAPPAMEAESAIARFASFHVRFVAHAIVPAPEVEET